MLSCCMTPPSNPSHKDSFDPIWQNSFPSTYLCHHLSLSCASRGLSLVSLSLKHFSRSAFITFLLTFLCFSPIYCLSTCLPFHAILSLSHSAFSSALLLLSVSFCQFSLTQSTSPNWSECLMKGTAEVHNSLKLGNNEQVHFMCNCNLHDCAFCVCVERWV